MKNKGKRTLSEPYDYQKINWDRGYSPPQSIDLEVAVLGGCLIEQNAFQVALELLRPECFYIEAHQIIFKTMMDMDSAGIMVDNLTLMEKLKQSGQLDQIGGPYFIVKLTNDVISTAFIESHARIIIQKFILRELIKISHRIIVKSFNEEEDVFDILDEAENNFSQISIGNIKSHYSSLENLAVKRILHIENLRNKKQDVTGVPSGYRPLDVVTSGWQSGDLIILAARPSVGKTSLALNFARNASKQGFPIGIFSLEMSKEQITDRFLSMESNIELSRIRRGKMDDSEFASIAEKCLNDIHSWPILIDDEPGINIYELRSKARKMVIKDKVKMIIVDYLQLMGGFDDKRGFSREQEVSKITRDLKGLAKELQIPIIALSQMSRQIENRKNGIMEPQLSDLRESGAIEQDADMVIFLVRADYQIEDYKVDPTIIGESEAKIKKHRNGALETISFKVDWKIQKWESRDNIEYFKDKINEITVPSHPPVRSFSEPQFNDEMPF